MTKKEYSAADAQPVIIYAKTNQNSDVAVPISCDTNGNLTISVSVTSGATTITNTVSTIVIGTVAITGSTTLVGTSAVGGDVASGSADSGNPLKTGGIGKQANPTAVSDGQRVGSLYDDIGRQVVTLSIRDLKVIQQTTITTTASTIIVTSVASTFLDVYGLVITNSSGTASTITIKEGAGGTGGTQRIVIAVPANDTRGFMLPESAAVPQSVVTRDWLATISPAVANIEITALAIKNV